MALNNTILQTGFRHIAILCMLYENDLSKTEIVEKLYEKYKIKISMETLKLDINTIVNAGFKIKRGNRGNKFRMHLYQDFQMLKFNKKDALVFAFIKNFAFSVENFYEIYLLRKFYKKLLPFFEDSEQSIIFDFGFFNFINENILDKLVCFQKTEKTCDLIYNSSSNIKKEVKAIIKNIILRNEKIYADCIFEDRDFIVTLRIDNIVNITESNSEILNRNFKNKSVKYVIKRSWYDNFPLESNERVVGISNKKVEIELLEDNDFFITQRIMTYGTNCIEIKNEYIKKRVIKALEETLGQYK